MEKTSSFTIYNASAGSGKTFTLVREYLKKLLLSKKEGYYKHLLAITFTNKAVAEMKQRVIETLTAFSEPDIVSAPSNMLIAIASETGLSKEYIHTQSKIILKHLLHHYALFSVETIDHFNHRLIRTFARDLKLPAHFEVSLDAPHLLREAVDQLISKAGDDIEVTQVLLSFALQKTDEDKSWDIARDLSNTATILLHENDRKHVTSLRQKSLDDFANFKIQIQNKKQKLQKKIQKEAQDVLDLIAEGGLEHDDFSRGYLPKHFFHLVSGKYALNFNAQWQSSMGEKPLYPGRVSDMVASTIDSLTPQFIESFQKTRDSVYQVLFYDAVLKNLVPLSVISLVNQELDLIKEEKNILPINEFNALIHDEIKDQPAPFIYERLGERYRHFFIDEFQDTSMLQWQNLQPLIDNSLSQQFLDGSRGSLLLVGDAKQSIYRWRGGLPEQFMDLYADGNPFSISEKDVLNLESNYRSYSEVINFNNAFFSYLATHLTLPEHKDLYSIGNKQLTTELEGGYVKITFLDAKNKAEVQDLNATYVTETILEVLEQGFSEKDICIITRTKKDGIALSTHLMEEGISVISSETLLLKHSPSVQCLINTLTLAMFPHQEEVRIKVLRFLHEHFQIKEQKHSFYASQVKTSPELFSEKLKTYGIDFSFDTMRSLSLYESCEYILRAFNLSHEADAFVFGFMDVVFDFMQRPLAGKLQFLDYWEAQKDSTSVTSNSSGSAIQLMTIHKSKGLEFPVVIFPYADMNLYEDRNAKVWFPLETEMEGFDEVLINYKKEIANYGDQGAQIYAEKHSIMELDTINLLYVTLTRAIERLYVFSQKPAPLRGNSPTNYGQLFETFLKETGVWKEEESSYEFGIPSCFSSEKETPRWEQITPEYPNSPLGSHSVKLVSKEALLWNTTAEEAINVGNILHDAMAHIKQAKDIEVVMEDMALRSILPKTALSKLKETITRIITHPELCHLFDPDGPIFMERDILTSDGTFLRPDRLNFHKDNLVTITDYKTGEQSDQHLIQINGYATALFEMGYQVSEKLLIYIVEGEILINKV